MWYFINLTLETTVGVLLSYSLLKLTEKLARATNNDSLISGHYTYEKDNEIDLASWAIQLILWGGIIVVVKDIQAKSIIIVVIVSMQGTMSELGYKALEPLDPHPELELVVVMICVPMVLNIFQFWVQDSFLKGK